MWRLLVLVVVLVLAVVSSAEQCGQMKCPECKNQPTPESCPSGCLTKDLCGCCLVCAKLKDERCRGANNYFGNCADGLYCDGTDLLTTGGICKECMSVCTIEYCGGGDKDKACSATGVMKSMSNTDECQHTTCGSCFHVADPKPPCQRCNHENQTKQSSYNKCIRAYHACLRRHYRSSSVIQNLTAVTNSTIPGFIFCKAT